MPHLKPERDLLQNCGSKEHLLIIHAIGTHIPSSKVSASKMKNQEELEPEHSLAGAMSHRIECSTWKFIDDSQSIS